MGVERAVLIVIGLAAGVLGGIGAFVLVDRARTPTDPVVFSDEVVVSQFPAVTHDELAAADLRQAWENWRQSTFYARGDWERRLDDGDQTLSGPVLLVQDPPRRLVARLGSLVEQIDGDVFSCDPLPEDSIGAPCVTGSGTISYSERVQRELDAVDTYVFGDQRAFNVQYADAPGCYQAESRTFNPAVPWGLWAQFCFDHDTRVMISSRIRRESAIDIEAIFESRSVVTDADFEPDS